MPDVKELIQILAIVVWGYIMFRLNSIEKTIEKQNEVSRGNDREQYKELEKLKCENSYNQGYRDAKKEK